MNEETGGFKSEVTFDAKIAASGVLVIMVLNLFFILVCCSLAPLLFIPAIDVENFLRMLPPNAPNLDHASAYRIMLVLLIIFFLILIGPMQYLYYGARALARSERLWSIIFCASWVAWNGSFILLGLQNAGLDDLLPLSALFAIGATHVLGKDIRWS